MKVTNESLKIIIDICQKVVNFYRDEMKINLDLSKLTESEMNFIYFKGYCSIQYEDNNPNVLKINDKRLFEYNPNFKYYQCDTNDNTLNTAIKQAFKSIT